jgi:hypothetical protein
MVVFGGHFASMPVVYEYSESKVAGVAILDLATGTWRPLPEVGTAPDDPQSTTALPDGTVLVVGVDKAARLSFSNGKAFTKPIRAAVPR